ncbi:unnamed protein product [Mytilus edulis]|uniref:Uncharacterized protein n=1 Tax=Mytilus edulis TaxID=6550 RepID=A0A8S3SZT9_MYTED|nr:unnamed protein product [Mytilus edulis]
MARHYKKYAKRNKHKQRLKNKAAMQQSKLKFMLSQARKQVVNLSHRKLTDDEYLVLSRGLKFIPSPSVKRAKQDLLHDFDELARKMRCRYLYHGNLDEIHPFRVKSGHTPPLTCNTLENYLFNTKHELSSMQIRKFRNNLSLSQRSGISSLLNDESLIIKKADKSNNVVILDKVNYLLEGDRQLNTQHYTKLENFDLKALRCNINTYVKGMYTKGVIDYSTFNYLNNGIDNSCETFSKQRYSYISVISSSKDINTILWLEKLPNLKELMMPRQKKKKTTGKQTTAQKLDIKT